MACGVPLFKSDDKSLFSNYRPVSVVPIFFQILREDCLCSFDKIYYLDKHMLLAKTQYDFRKNHSTSLALLHLHDKMTSAFSAVDERKHTAGL